MKKKYSPEMEAIIAADPDLQRYREIDDRELGPAETMVEQVLVAVEIYLRDSGRGLPRSVAKCAHPEESVEVFHDTHHEATEHAEWCSICGAYRLNSGYDDKRWTLPQSIKYMLIP